MKANRHYLRFVKAVRIANNLKNSGREVSLMVHIASDVFVDFDEPDREGDQETFWFNGAFMVLNEFRDFELYSRPRGNSLKNYRLLVDDKWMTVAQAAKLLKL